MPYSRYSSSMKGSPWRVHFSGIQRAFGRAYQDVVRHHTLQVSAALSYYFVLAAFPCLIFLSAVVGYIPVPNLFGGVLLLMGRLLPVDTMRILYSVPATYFRRTAPRGCRLGCSAPSGLHRLHSIP